MLHRMPWWGWIVVGAVLLVAELTVDSAFYLAIFGLAAVLVGVGGLLEWTGPMWTQWAIFAALSVALLVGLRGRIHSWVRAPVGTEPKAIVGEFATVLEAIAPGEMGRAELRGANWSARNSGGSELSAGQRVRVQRVDGIVLELSGEG